MTVGTELKQARERAKLSAEEISEQTKIQLYKIEALEKGEYQLLPQGIYLDGIVQTYAHELGIPHEPLVERVRLERGTLPGDWPVPFAAPIELYPKAAIGDEVARPAKVHILDDFQENDPLDSFTAESDFAREPVTQREEKQVLFPVAMRRQTRQRSGLALPLLALFAAIGLGLFFYRVRPSLESSADPAAIESVARPADPADTAIGTSGEPRESQTTDARVRFTENVITPDRDEPRGTHAVPRDTPAISDTTASAARPVPRTAPTAASGNRSTKTTPPDRAPAAAKNNVPSVAVSNVAGSWTLATQVESSSLARFQGLQLGYEMRLKQDGERVTGVGRKVTENGAGLRRRAQTPMTVNGTIDGDRLMLNFVERGTRRPTQGKFVLLMDESGTLRGSFSSSAARSSGSVEARRLSTQ